jgi:dihydrofolate synthase/folylpolyglutamate synthase
VWPGRFEVFDTKPKIILDCAHNPGGAETLAKTLSEFYGRRKHVFVLGISGYKDIDGILSILAPKIKAAVTAKSQHPQAAYPEVLCKKLTRYNIPCIPASSVADAITTAQKLASKEDVIVFAGSIFFVGDVRKILTKSLDRL